jgi:uncharacterized membrane protein
MSGKAILNIFFFFLLNSFNVFIALVGISYLRPNFSRGYLTGKEHIFHDTWFPVGLYWHALTAPIALLLISALVLFRLEQRFKKTHRFLGKTALLLIFLAIVPSGWILSYFAMGGILGKLIFFTLSSYTAFVALQGYSAIKKREIQLHRYWMLELMALLASAVLLRLLLLTFRWGLDFTGNSAYNLAALLSWIPSIILLRVTLLRTLKK